MDISIILEVKTASIPDSFNRKKAWVHYWTFSKNGLTAWSTLKSSKQLSSKNVQ
jgi:hypothetical protein